MAKRKLITDYFTSPNSSQNDRKTICPKIMQKPFDIPDLKPKTKKRLCNKDEKQYVLDAGQKFIGKQHCLTCDMVYGVDSYKDVLMHEKYHNRFTEVDWFRVSTSQIQQWKKNALFEQCTNGYFCGIDSSSKSSLKPRLEKIVLECVNIELGHSEETENFWGSEASRFAWIFIRDQLNEFRTAFIGGVLLIEPVCDVFYSSKSDFAELSEMKRKRNGPFMGVNRIWVHQKLRRQRIATCLLECARKYFIDGCVSKNEVAFSPPTKDGLKFALNYVGNDKVLLYT